MAGAGAILVVNGSGSRRAADGGGRITATVTNGTAVPEVIPLVRLIRRIATGGLCHVPTTAAAIMGIRYRVGATAVSTDRSI